MREHALSVELQKIERCIVANQQGQVDILKGTEESLGVHWLPILRRESIRLCDERDRLLYELEQIARSAEVPLKIVPSMLPALHLC